MQHYDLIKQRTEINSGDLLVWSKDTRGRGKSSFFLNLVRLMTRSEYAHTAIAWRIDGRLFAVDATIPYVRLMPITNKDEFYHIPMNVAWDKNCEKFLLDKIGLSYSFLDGLRAFLGKTVQENDDWQCAELCTYFYREVGIELGEAYTPSKVVKSAMSVRDTYLRKINSIPS